MRVGLGFFGDVFETGIMKEGRKEGRGAEVRVGWGGEEKDREEKGGEQGENGGGRWENVGGGGKLG